MKLFAEAKSNLIKMIFAMAKIHLNAHECAFHTEGIS